MRFLRPAAAIAGFLIIAVSIPQSYFSQNATQLSQRKHPTPRQRQSGRSERAESLAPAINELLKLDPFAPESPGGKDSGNAGASTKREDKPPADDAPIKELIAYWIQSYDTNAPKPTEQTRERLLEACEARPELIPGLIGFLPENSVTHDRLFKLLEEEPANDRNWKGVLRNWLQRNSRYFRDDLIAAARGAGENGTSSGDSLRSLAKLDWEAARPIVETFASAGNAQTTPVALSLLYERAQQDGDATQAEKYRALLKAIVANRQAPSEARQGSISSLVKTDWSGQEEWFVSLFSDPTLTGMYEGDVKDPAASARAPKAPAGTLTGTISLSDTRVIEHTRSDFLTGADLEKPADETFVLGGRPSDDLIELYRDQSSFSIVLDENLDKWLPIICDMIGHNQRAIHIAAVKCLTEFLNNEAADEKQKKDIAQRLAPWLTDPNWAAANDRSEFIQSLVNLQAPELLPGLIWVLEHDTDQSNRAAAAEAVTQYRDPRAIPSLRRALEQEESEDRREKIVAALAEAGGFSDYEMASAIEAYAKTVVTEMGAEKIDLAQTGESEKPLPLKISIGRILHESETIQVTEGVAVMLIERAKALRASQPAVARQILRSIEDAPLRVAQINLVERIGAGWADIDSIKLALENRDSIRKSAGDELYSLIKQGGYAAGIAAAILNDEREQRDALGGTDAKAQLALLAGARYLRDKLPVELAGKLLDSPIRALAKAAESYLEVEDSPEARKLALARHRNEAYILGDSAAFGRETLVKWEEAMRKELKGAAGLEAIYAMARPDARGSFIGVVIRVRERKAEISLYEVEGRREVRPLTESEFGELKSFTSRQEVEDLGPESYADNSVRSDYVYLRLTREGGRRIVLDGLRRATKNPTLHEELSGLFYRLSRSGEFVTRYEIEDKIPGVELLLADKKQAARMVCGEGTEIRVLIGEKGAEYNRGLAETMPEWREFSSGKPGELAKDPKACRVMNMISTMMKNRWNGHSRDIGLPTRFGDAWIYSSAGEDPGVWKYEPGTEPVKIVSGPYFSPVLTPDGKWMVAMMTMNERGEYRWRLVRHNLQTGKEFTVSMTDGDYHPPVTYIATHGKVLLGSGGYYGEAFMGPINYLLDPETGTVQQVKGEFGPLKESFARELQPTGNPNEFWAAVPDWNKRATSLGRYNARSFVFTPLVELPELILRNNDFWVDAASGKIWITYQGQLLRIPLPKNTK